MNRSIHVLLISGAVFYGSFAYAQSEERVEVSVTERQSFVVGKIEAPCKDIGQRLKSEGVSSEAKFKLNIAKTAAYQTVEDLFTSLLDAGYKPAIGTVNTAE